MAKSSLKIAMVAGTRPELIKMSPLIRECQRRRCHFLFIHAGQHYSYTMDKVFFRDLQLPKAHYHLDISSTSQGAQTANMLEGIERVLIREKPTIVLVEGDTNSVLAGALAASKLHIPIGHVEACLRSFDKTMPEEINRIMVDHMSEFLFAPTFSAKRNGLKENLPAKKIFVTGNTVVDALYQHREISQRKSMILSDLNLTAKRYMLLTLHRQENVDQKGSLQKIFMGLRRVVSEFNMPVIYPMHLRTKKRIHQFGLRFPANSVVMEPVGFLDFLKLEENAALILTDSGGVQEEACILKVPCVTLRNSTERPETIAVGSNVLSGIDPEKILSCCRLMLRPRKGWRHPFGDGKAALKIITMIERHYDG